MKAKRPCPQFPPAWTRKNLIAIIAVLLVLQAGLILLFGSWSAPAPAAPPPPVHFTALSAPASSDDLMRQFFVCDPSVFIFPNRHDFSGRGWLNDTPAGYQSTDSLEAPALLALNPTRLGTNFAGLPHPYANVQPANLPEPPSEREEPLPSFLKPDVLPTQSSFQIEGELANRWLGPEPSLKSWPSAAQVLKSSRVQIAVDAAGGVVASRLESGCGLAEADGAAVAASRALRFRPAPRTGAQWGETVFHWHTAAPK